MTEMIYTPVEDVKVGTIIRMFDFRVEVTKITEDQGRFQFDVSAFEADPDQGGLLTGLSFAQGMKVRVEK